MPKDKNIIAGWHSGMYLSTHKALTTFRKAALVYSWETNKQLKIKAFQNQPSNSCATKEFMPANDC